jgi:hypothetical protein
MPDAPPTGPTDASDATTNVPGAPTSVLKDVPETPIDVRDVLHVVPTNIPANVPNPPSTDIPSEISPTTPPATLPIAGATPPPPPYLAALTGLTVLATPLAVAGLIGTFISFGSDPTARILAGCSVGFDVLLVLCGVGRTWRSPASRKGLWGLGIWPLFAGLAVISGAAFLTALEWPNTPVAALATLGRALAGVGTGTLTVYWLRANTGSVRPPAHSPSIPDWARTSRTAVLLAFSGLVFCGVRTDVLTSTYLLPVQLLSAWLVVSLVRAPHSPLTLLLTRIGWTVRRRIARGNVHVLAEQTSIAVNTCVVRSGRVIDLDGIPTELRLLPLPRKSGQEEQRVGAVQTE